MGLKRRSSLDAPVNIPEAHWLQRRLIIQGMITIVIDEFGWKLPL